jgi:hypothetical protein
MAQCLAARGRKDLGFLRFIGQLPKTITLKKGDRLRTN